MKKLTFFLMSAVVVLASSCLKDQKDYFDKSSAERLQEVQENLRALLADNQYGWRIEYFIGNTEQDRGGKNLTLKFGKDLDTVCVRSEEFVDSSFTSHFKLTGDDGPVLSFDTYNGILHKYAVPSSSYYEARGGDFEFLIIDYSPEKIVLKGKRSGKTSVLYPLAEDAKTFTERLHQSDKAFYVSSFEGTLGSTAVKGEIDVRNRQFTITEKLDDEYADAETTTLPYILTEKGLQFYEPEEFLGTTLESLTYSAADTTFSAAGVSLKGFIPKDWRPYEFFEGSYMFLHNDGMFQIELVPTEDQESYRANGFGTNFDIFMFYDIKTGRLNIEAQFVTAKGSDEVLQEGENYVIMAPLGESGYFGLDGEGYSSAWNMREDRPVYVWENNGRNARFMSSELMLRLYNLTDGFVRDSQGYSMGPSVAKFNGNKASLTPKSMQKR